MCAKEKQGWGWGGVEWGGVDETVLEYNCFVLERASKRKRTETARRAYVQYHARGPVFVLCPYTGAHHD